MFKWKVSRLGSKKERTKQRLNNATDTTKEAEEIYVKNVNNNNKERWAKKKCAKNNNNNMVGKNRIITERWAKNNNNNKESWAKK